MRKLLTLFSALVVSYSYLSGIIGIISIQPMSISSYYMYYIAFIFFIVKIYDMIYSHKRKRSESRLSFGWPDIFSFIVCAIETNQRYSIIFFDKIKNSTFNVVSKLFIPAFTVVTFFIVVNEIMLSYNNGLIKIFRTLYYDMKYRIIYWYLNLLNDHAFLFSSFRNNKTLSFNLSPIEFNTFIRAAAWYKNKQGDKKRKFPVILRKDAENRSFIRNWLYNISLVNGKNIQVHKKSQQGTGLPEYEAHINLTNSKLAIINNDGKAFLRSLHIKQTNSRLLINLNKDNKAAHDFLSNNSSKPVLELDDDCFYRWGSAGSIPLVNYKGEKYIAFVYRDIYPNGWNLPLGASECELEKNRPAITAIRETFEELLVLKGPVDEYSEIDSQSVVRRELYHHLLNNIENEVHYKASKRRFYKYQNDILKETCLFVFDEESTTPPIDCYSQNTNLNIRVQDDNRTHIISNSLSTNCLLVINPLENAIECIKPIEFSLNAKNELRMGEIDYIEEKWVNNPVILIKYSVLEQFFKVNKETIREEDREGLYLEILENPDNYVLFGVHMKSRKKRLDWLQSSQKNTKLNLALLGGRNKMKRVNSQIKYLKDFIEKNSDYFIEAENREIINPEMKEGNPAMMLCPVSWKALTYFFSSKSITPPIIGE